MLVSVTGLAPFGIRNARIRTGVRKVLALNGVATKARQLGGCAQKCNQCKILARLDTMTVKTKSLQIRVRMSFDDAPRSNMINVLQAVQVPKTFLALKVLAREDGTNPSFFYRSSNGNFKRLRRKHSGESLFQQETHAVVRAERAQVCELADARNSELSLRHPSSLARSLGRLGNPPRCQSRDRH